MTEVKSFESEDGTQLIFQARIDQVDLVKMPKPVLAGLEAGLMEVVEAATGEIQEQLPSARRREQMLKFWGGLKTIPGLLLAIFLFVLTLRAGLWVAEAAWGLIP